MDNLVLLAQAWIIVAAAESCWASSAFLSFRVNWLSWLVPGVREVANDDLSVSRGCDVELRVPCLVMVTVCASDVC